MIKKIIHLLCFCCIHVALWSQTFTASIDNNWNPPDDGQQALASSVNNSFTFAATNDVVSLPNGQLVVACGDSYNQSRVYGLARTNANGQLDLAFTTPNNLQSRVFNTLALQSDGKILAGGRVEFSFLSGLAANNLHRYNADGNYDASFTQGTHDLDGVIKKILVLPNGKILVAGSFTTYNGTSVGRLVRLLPDGTIDGSFNAGTAASNTIENMLLLPSEQIIIVGAFTSYNGTTANRIARLNSDGSIDAAFAVNADNTVYTVAAIPGDKIIVGGNFTSINSIARNRLALLNANGNIDVTFGNSNQLLANGIVKSTVALPDGTIAVVGQFTTFNGVARPSHVCITQSGDIVLGYNTEPFGVGAGIITGLLPQGSDKIIFFGNFSILQRINFGGITRINFKGEPDATFNPNGGAGGTLASHVSTLHRLPDGRIMLGGLFNKFNGVSCYNTMRLLPDGLPDPSFEPGNNGPNGDVRAMAIQPDNKIVIAGGFSSLDGKATPGLARLLQNGRLDTSFTPLTMNTFSSTDVRVIKLMPDGKMYIGGDFQKIGSNTNLKYIARILPNGLPDPSFTPPIFNSVFGRVNDIMILDDGKIIIGGANLELPSESIRRSLIRLQADGSYDASFNSGNAGFDVNNNPVVSGIIKSSNNQLIIWGDFFSYNAQSRRYLVALNLDGTLVTPNPFISLPANFILPDKLIEQPNGKLLVTSNFNFSAGSINYRGLLRLNSNGSIDLNFRVGTGFQALNGATLSSIGASLVDDAILVESKLLVCGGFTDFNGVIRNRVARINLGDVSLPVKWRNFTVYRTNGVVQINWRTASEFNNSGFHIQHSTDGLHFSNIAFILAKGDGNSAIEQSYFFSDGLQRFGKNYYRLQQIDKDGAISYSEVRFLLVPSKISASIYPNPASDFLQISLTNNQVLNEKINILIHDEQGRIITQSTTSKLPHTLPINSIAPGAYTVTILMDDFRQTIRWIKK